MVDWKVQTYEGGDIFAKAVVRILEMQESIKIINQCLERLKTEKGPVRDIGKRDPRRRRHRKARGASWRMFPLRKERQDEPAGAPQVRAPSYVNVATNQKAVVGYHISDALLLRRWTPIAALKGSP